MTRQGGMKQAARDWLNRTDATGNGILNRKNESDVRTGLTSVRQLLYFPLSCFFTSPYWCTLSPNSTIEKKEISNDRARPMKADQGWYRLGALTIQPWMQRDSASELGFGIPSRASISSVKGDSRKDGIGRRVSRTNKIRVENGKLAKLDKIGMGIGTCIDVPDRLMLPG
ncbi:hypothetical protein SLEP1_g59711 [Rubroshorea leprosula]|uniref:Uncharacterized protein n=1 Tax=Rubroshorea leprosula TaxID=152421 RepID=A0AAV5MT48_9ROSI|nr:hypothetical protein SLEP1_g59711 [Rubroshorea leprosula]